MGSGFRIIVAEIKPATPVVLDKASRPSQETSLLKDSRLRMNLKVADTDELLGWILSFGSQVQVARPEAVRQGVREEARKMLGSST